MDWIDEVFKRLGDKLTNGTLRKAIFVYISTAVIIVIMATLGTMAVCHKWNTLIESRYLMEDNQVLTVPELSPYTVSISWLSNGLSEGDRLLVIILNFVQSFSPFIYSVLATLITSYLFYHDKLKEPIEILKDGARHISQNELDFECSYCSLDEMGEVCAAFEQMRVTLILNNQNMWDMMEEQRRLKAAFAHDIRTPLTVLHGYADFLYKYYPTGKIPQEKLMENLELMNAQVMRLIHFTDTMKEVNSMEELILRKRRVPQEELEKKVGDFVSIMNEMSEENVSFHMELIPGGNWMLDDMVFMEVLENMVTNAIRYADSSVEITIEESDDGEYILLYVRDDGCGFTGEGMMMALRPYYSDQKGKEDETHYGIGLFISDFLCKKHGGYLDLANSIDGGAMVCAAFHI